MGVKEEPHEFWLSWFSKWVVIFHARTQRSSNIRGKTAMVQSWAKDLLRVEVLHILCPPLLISLNCFKNVLRSQSFMIYQFNKLFQFFRSLSGFMEPQSLTITMLIIVICLLNHFHLSLLVFSSVISQRHTVLPSYWIHHSLYKTKPFPM